MDHANDLTRKVLDGVARTGDPRLRTILSKLVKHLHAFVREAEISESELLAGIDFLTRTGHMCTGGRQEFILLSDVLGVSMLVDSQQGGTQPGVTASTVLGPFHTVSPTMANGSDIGDATGEHPLWVDGRVTSADGRPLEGATIEVWHSDDAGLYDLQRADLNGAPRFRGTFVAGKDGEFNFWTNLPSAYPIPSDGPVGELLAAMDKSIWRPAHVHFLVSAPGYRRLVTQVFLADDAHLATDPVFGVKDELIVQPEVKRASEAPEGRTMTGSWYLLRQVIALEAMAAVDT